MNEKGIGTFYLGRVIKIGTLTSDSFIEALKETRGVFSKNYKWNIIETIHVKESGKEYFFGKLAKYAPDGEAPAVDENLKKNISDIVPNLLLASVPFIYIPEFSGISYLKLWNQIDESAFKNRISDIVLKYHQRIFVDMEINDIVENDHFVSKVKEFDTISSISCKVNRPNPLYGDIWKKLKDYLIKRNSEKLELKEETTKSDGIKSILKSNEDVPPDQIELLDSAIFMAIDGYGTGTLKGVMNGKNKTIKVGKNPITLKLVKDITPEEMYVLVKAELLKINSIRGLKH